MPGKPGNLLKFLSFSAGILAAALSSAEWLIELSRRSLRERRAGDGTSDSKSRSGVFCPIINVSNVPSPPTLKLAQFGQDHQPWPTTHTTPRDNIDFLLDIQGRLASCNHDPQCLTTLRQ